MSNIDSGASAQAASSGVPIEAPPTQTQPLGSQTPVTEKPAPVEKPATVDDKAAKPDAEKAVAKNSREALERAFEKVEKQPAKDAAAKAAEPDKPVDKSAAPDAKPQARGDDGKFAPTTGTETPAAAKEPLRPSHTAEDAPARFSETAKAKWHEADAEMRSEVLRMQRELTDGYQKHKSAAERDESLKEFHEMAGRTGTTVRDALSRFTNMENSARQEIAQGSYPIKTFQSICEQMGFSLKDMAAAVMGQTPDQQQSQSDATIRELRQTVAKLEQQVGGVTKTIEQQRNDATLVEINAFAKDNSRFEELSEDIAFFLQSGRAKDLPEAYQMADRLNPASARIPALKAASSAATDPDPDAQSVKGSKSISGAPASGADSQLPKPASSNREALKRAFARLG